MNDNKKCKCYHERIETRYIKEIRTTQKVVGYCWGTKECEPCSCEGDKSKCDFYDYVREKAQKETLEYKIEEAIKLLEKNGYKVEK